MAKLKCYLHVFVLTRVQFSQEIIDKLDLRISVHHPYMVIRVLIKDLLF